MPSDGKTYISREEKVTCSKGLEGAMFPWDYVDSEEESTTQEEAMFSWE